MILNLNSLCKFKFKSFLNYLVFGKLIQKIITINYFIDGNFKQLRTFSPNYLKVFQKIK